MEERLSMFIQEYEKLSLEHVDISADAVPIIRFVNHQVLEVARDCLKKSEEKLITRGYFYEMSEKLELLLVEVNFMHNWRDPLNKNVNLFLTGERKIRRSRSSTDRDNEETVVDYFKTSKIT